MGLFNLFKSNVEKMEERKDVDGLIRALKNKDSRVKGDAAEALDKLYWKSKDDVEKAYYLIAKKYWDKVIKVGEPAVEPLINALKDVKIHVQKDAAMALGDIGDKRAVEPLINALKDEDSDVIAFAAIALGKMGNNRGVEPLINALKDEDIYVRIAAAESLGNIGDSQAVEPLTQALHDKDEDVREAAKEALKKIK